MAKLQFVPCSRLPAWPVWAMVLTTTWAALVAAAAAISTATRKPIDLCLFKRFMGLPCPTCGLERATINLLHGQFLHAWLFNPLGVILVVGVIAALLIRVATGRHLEIRASRRLRLVIWGLLMAIAAVNWMYVIVKVG